MIIHNPWTGLVIAEADAGDHLLKRQAFKFANYSWSGIHKIALNGIDWSWIDVPTQLQTSAVITPISPF